MIKSNIDSVCFVAKITEINSIPEADKIEQVKCGDYSCISLKGANTIGELVILATTDAVIPMDLSEKLNITNYLRKGNRVKTIKLKKTWSECLIIKPGQVYSIIQPELFEGRDMEKELGIFKYEEPEKIITTSNGKKVRIKDNPEFRIYTKFPNIKNVDNMFEPNELITVQRKIHGSNFRCGIVPCLKHSWWKKLLAKIGLIKLQEKEYIYGSHRVNISYRNKYTGFYGENIYRKMSEKYNIEQKLWKYLNSIQTYNDQVIHSFEIYAEVYGSGIQGEYNYGLNDQELACFDIQINGKYLSPYEVESVLKELELPMVEVYSVGMSYDYFIKEKDRFLSMKIPNSKLYEEGVVLKSVIQGESNLRAVKVISPYYLEYCAKNDIPENH